MTDEDKSVESEDTTPKRRPGRPSAKTKKEDQQEVQVDPAQEEVTDIAVQGGREITSEERANPFVAQHQAELDEDSPRIVEKGEAIDVATDEDGFATETVLREAPLPGSDTVTYKLVVSKGTFYQK